MAPTKYSEAQLALMQKAFEEGLSSTSSERHGAEYSELAAKTGVSVEKLKTWVNNKRRERRKGGNRPTISDVMEGVEDGSSTSEGRALHKRAPSQRRLSAWNLFCRKVFSEELKDVPKETKIVEAQKLYTQLSEEEKKKLEADAKRLSEMSVNDMSQHEVNDRVMQSMRRILKEMEYIEQFGAVGYCLVMKPNKLLVNASTLKGEEFLVSDSQTSQRFSAFCDVPAERSYSKSDVRLFLNKKYSLVIGKPSAVQYKQYQKTFRVEGWPDSVPFKTPSRMGPTQLKKVMEKREDITFIVFDKERIPIANEAENTSTQVPDDVDDAALNEENGMNLESDVAAHDIPPQKRLKRGKTKSVVKKGDIVPVYAPRNESDEEDSDAYQFWLFSCAGKVKTDETIRGKWLVQTEEERSFIVLPQPATILESNIIVENGSRLILPTDSFEEIIEGKYKLTVAACNWLQDLAIVV